MPQVYTQKKSSRGSKRVCGRAGCGHVIQPGERFYWWKFRYGGKQVRCMEHSPQQYELTQSKMSTVYQAMDEARNNLGTLEETKAAIESLASTVEEVVQEYRDAAEPFGGGGPNGEKAEELEGWLDELQQFEPEEPDESEFDEDEHRDEALELVQEDEDLTLADAMQQVRETWEEEHGDNLDNVAEAAQEEAAELINSCPM